MSAPRSSGAIEVAPDALGSARAGSGPSGGLARRWCEPALTPAAERSRAPPPALRGGGFREPGPGTTRQKFLRPQVDKEPGTRKALSARW
jgi:hypothetical protein